MTPVAVFPCGEPLRGDDGVAAAAVVGLLDPLAASATVRACTGLSASDLLELPGATPVLIVDAVRGVEPGDLVRVDLGDLEGLLLVRGAISSHQLPLDLVIGLARTLGWAGHGTFLGMGVARTELGEGLTDAVAAAIPRLRSAILLEVARLATPDQPAEGAS